MTTPHQSPSSALEQLRRWEDSGGTWAVMPGLGDELTISLRTCTAGEEVERLVTDADDVREHIGGRERSDD